LLLLLLWRSFIVYVGVLVRVTHLGWGWGAIWVGTEKEAAIFANWCRKKYIRPEVVNYNGNKTI